MRWLGFDRSHWGRHYHNENETLARYTRGRVSAIDPLPTKDRTQQEETANNESRGQIRSIDWTSLHQHQRIKLYC